MSETTRQNKLNWWTKRKLYRLGYYLMNEYDGIHSQPFESFRQRTYTDTSFKDWAIEFCDCGMVRELDHHYLQPGNSYRTIPAGLKAVDRRFWQKVREKEGLIREGMRLLQLHYG